jgi:hypothetical protein
MNSFPRRVLGFFFLIAANLAVFAALFVVFEVGMHIIWPEENPFLSPPVVESKVRIASPIYGHTLAPNYKGYERWGAETELVTNSLGFKDATRRNVPLGSDRKRVLFLGDSFTEALGVSYEDSFVGRFAADFPQLDVLNAGVASYAPSVYYTKAKYLLEMGLQIDEIIVYTDLSDIQDEAIFYRFDQDGHVKEANFDENCRSPEIIFFSELPKWGYWSYTIDFLYKRWIVSTLTRSVQLPEDADLTLLGRAYGPDRARASWTYDPQPVCYGTMGVEGGIAKAITQMDRLYALASSRNIPLSVGVYPWPQQLLYDSEDSRQVRIWRDWCKDKCRRFFNHFPPMFAYKREHPNFLRDLFVAGDIHYNPFGNQVIARDLIAQYRAPASEREP